MDAGATLCIFGATGDLAAGKILPALEQWYDGGEVPFARIWCLGRRPLATDAYCALIEEKGGFRLGRAMRDRLAYHRLEFDDAAAYAALAERLGPVAGDGGLRLFFLAVKPEAFVPVASRLFDAGLLRRGERGHRLLFEKPFGDSLASAGEIQARLLAWATEEQMYRIDHYLGKEMIRNVLAIRFANRIFSESWHGGAVESVELTSVETAGVEERLDYYDRAGAINDMVQSHLLQMLALVAMEAPDTFEAEPVRRRKLEVLEQVSLDPLHLPVAGQYAGYRELLPASLTETAVEATLRIESPRWQGTRFCLRTGKRLAEKRTEIRLRFRPTRLCLDCAESLEAEANELVVEIFPEEGIRFAFNSKVPGYSFDLEKVMAEYCHSCRMIGNKPEAYVKLLKDALAGDTTLFTSFAELQAQWRIADRIRAAAQAAGLVVYPVGAVRVGHGGGGSC